jgi:hypothetical protein
MENGVPQCNSEGKQYHDFSKEHAQLGKEMVMKMSDEIFEKYHLDKKEIAEIVGCHDLPLSYVKKMRKAETFDKFESLLHELQGALSEAPAKAEDILEIFVADSLGKGTHSKQQPDLLKLYGYLKDKAGTKEELYEIMKSVNN